MIVYLALIVGLVVGLLRARARRGNRLDMLQYAAVHAIAFGVLGLALNIALIRLL